MNKITTTSFLNAVFLVIISILSLMSLVAIITIHWTLFDISEYSISLKPIGVNNYLSAYGAYKTLFIATVTTIAAYLGLLRLKAATEANNDKLKQDRFNEWKVVLDNRFPIVINSDPDMKRIFIEMRYKLFCHLFKLNFKISNKKELTQIFTTILNEWVGAIEVQNKHFNNYRGIYKDQNHSYSFANFYFVFGGCVDDIYSEFYEDLKSLYLSGLDKDRIIDNTRFLDINPVTVNYSDL